MKKLLNVSTLLTILILCSPVSGQIGHNEGGMIAPMVAARSQEVAFRIGQGFAATVEIPPTVVGG